MATECQKVLSSQITKKPPKTKYYTPFTKEEGFVTNLEWFLSDLANKSNMVYPNYTQPLVVYMYIQNGQTICKLVNNTYHGITLHSILNNIAVLIGGTERLNFTVVDPNCAIFPNKTLKCDSNTHEVHFAGKRNTRKQKNNKMYTGKSRNNRRKSRKNRRKSNRRR